MNLGPCPGNLRRLDQKTDPLAGVNPPCGIGVSPMFRPYSFGDIGAPIGASRKMLLPMRNIETTLAGYGPNMGETRETPMPQ